MARRFWPLVGGAEKNLADLAAAWAGQGWEVTVVTARWQPHWPRDLLYRGVRLKRLADAPRDSWSTVRYARSIGRWLRRRRGEIDVVCVSRLRHEAYAAARALGRRVPLVLRAEGAGLSGDCRWHAQTPCGWRFRRCCRAAGALVAPSRSVEQDLLAAGFS
ncbi:MAG: glycosyltransferase family 4 protein, partial [Thermoguttaceae bacterium]|nr:glycosyltransferase family 4 protein [Thermoguttaceae bacterium]